MSVADDNSLAESVMALGRWAKGHMGDIAVARVAFDARLTGAVADG